ncbi:histidine kinase [Rhodocytophaga aerolata]|uniref:Histidine kinase n=2 Tax=Rhodocytophaga aerolata TaxID=455078 RepID=A0ABT8RH42_9BACT|nr:histidine kinase [Rhodocytophaga aerolata]MDO1451410.1 histidine kinase [Rhodocytophaga aerolata]
MRVVAFLFLLSMYAAAAIAQGLPKLIFHGQPTMEQGIPVEPYALFYEDPTADTLKPLPVIEQQPFLPPSRLPQIRSQTARQMKHTRQVIWLQFKITNTHPTDTIQLVYAGGIHAVYSLYLKTDSSFQSMGSSGLCVADDKLRHGYGYVPVHVPPNTTSHYYVRVADYLLLLDNIAGGLHTRQSFDKVVSQMLLQERWLFGALAIILGCLLLMGGYASFQYLLTHDIAFFYYALYTLMACVFVVVLANPRFSLGLTPVSLPWLGHPIALSLNHMLSLLYALFLTRLLGTSRQNPLLWRVIIGLMCVLATLQVMAFMQVFTGIWISSNTLYFMVDTLPSLLMGVLLIVATLLSESKLKGYLLAGQISLYVIAISPFHGLFALNNLSPQTATFLNYPPFYMMLGLCIELFCFALALAYRSKLVETEKNELQKGYARRLETELQVRTLQVQAQSEQLEKQHIQQLEQSFEQQLAEIQMMALRAQMNPHFIFNCLNSIQLYTTSNDAVKASDYLNRFSGLIRLVLENSRSEQVTLSNELEALRMYLEMEAMRFKDKLRFRIEVEKSLDTDLIEIPPLLLQPYVENAIWHGLMHKPEGGLVEVNVEPVQEDCLRITITDDGIGRTRATELKSLSATRHKSFGMKVTGERISLINRLYHTHTRVAVHDLTDAAGKPAGTLVVLEIPI